MELAGDRRLRPGRRGPGLLLRLKRVDQVGVPGRGKSDLCTGPSLAIWCGEHGGGISILSILLICQQVPLVPSDLRYNPGLLGEKFHQALESGKGQAEMMPSGACAHLPAPGGC